MPPRDFDDEFSQASERSPGVYTRSEGRSPSELDMLWSGSKVHKEDRSPFVFFIAGFVIAAILTSAVFLVLNNKPAEGDSPVAEQSEFLQSPVDDPLAVTPSNGQQASSKANTPDEHTTGATGSTSAKAKSTRSIPFKTYVVKNGDSLSGIAIKVYGSSSPAYVDKIQRANNLSSPDKLQLDQKLVIPPVN